MMERPEETRAQGVGKRNYEHAKDYFTQNPDRAIRTASKNASLTTCDVNFSQEHRPDENIACVKGVLSAMNIDIERKKKE